MSASKGVDRSLASPYEPPSRSDRAPADDSSRAGRNSLDGSDDDGRESTASRGDDFVTERRHARGGALGVGVQSRQIYTVYSM